MQAAIAGDMATMRSLLGAGAELERTDVFQRTAIMYAAMYGHLEACQCLLQHRAHVDARSFGGSTPLIAAAYRGHEEVVQMLLSHGATTEAADEFGWTPLMHAAVNSDHRMLQSLLSHRASPDTLDADGCTALVYAAFSGRSENVRMLLEWKADAREVPSVSTGLREAFLSAAIHGRTEVARLLLSASLIRPETRIVARRLAVEQGCSEELKMLLSDESFDDSADQVPGAMMVAGTTAKERSSRETFDLAQPAKAPSPRESSSESWPQIGSLATLCNMERYPKLDGTKVKVVGWSADMGRWQCVEIGFTHSARGGRSNLFALPSQLLKVSSQLVL